MGPGTGLHVLERKKKKDRPGRSLDAAPEPITKKERHENAK